MTFLPALSLKTKLVLSGAAFVLLLSLSVLVLLEQQVTPRLEEQLTREGLVIARDLSARSLEPALRGDLFQVQEAFQDTLRLNQEVRYAFITDSQGRLLAHSFSDGFPQGLYSLPPPGLGQDYLVTLLSTEEGLIRDIAVPLYPGKAGTVHVGMTERHVKEAIAETRRWVLLAAGVLLLFGLTAAYLLASYMTRPLKRLVEITRAVGRGDFQQRAPGGGDEIGELGNAFNVMTGELEHSRQELRHRNLELSALSVTTAAMVTSEDMEEALRRALSKVIEVMGVKAGWIFQTNPENGKLALTTHVGLSPEFALREATLEMEECICTRVLREKAPLVAENILECSRQGKTAVTREGLRCHASIPLQSRAGVVGIMNIASDSSREFSPYELKLMTSIGHLVGLAIENSHLWRDVRHREEMRRQLLAWFISAHEEERRKFAGALHDGPSQDLAAVLLGLKLVDSAPTLEEARRQAAEVYQLTQQTFDSVRQLSKDLRPRVLDDLGLVPALHSYIGRYTQRYAIPVELRTRGMEARLHPRVETVLYRAIQEALTNVAKHARAQRAEVVLERDGPEVRVTVSDDGQGFDHRKVLEATEGNMGLRGIRETVSLLGGSMEIESGDGAGTRLLITVPPTL